LVHLFGGKCFDEWEREMLTRWGLFVMWENCGSQ